MRSNVLRMRWAALGIASLAAAAGASAQDVPKTLRQQALQHFIGPLGSVPLPDPGPTYLGADRQALQRLGKALFWDQQLGSDGQACASCHFHAGADNRSKNQINPGFRNETPQFPTGDSNFDGGLGPNHQLTLADFPIQTNDVVSSQGVFAATFTGIGVPGDSGTSDLGSSTAKVFDVGGALVRSVPPRNTPSAVNAAYNRRNFWDSRARDEFNGADPIGDLDPTARVVKVQADGNGVPQPQLAPQFVAISVPGASTASQAVGPPLSDLEMSFSGRQFWHLGRKMLSPGLVPLGQQVVATDDSLLGSFSGQRAGPGVTGITLRYADLVRQAFPEVWWNAPAWRVDVSNPSQPAIVSSAAAGPNLYTLMEYNFAFFFGLAVSEYEKTLRATQTRFDSFLMGNESALDLKERNGLDLFMGRGRCKECHAGQLLSNASIAAQDTQPLQTDQLLPPHNIERMVIGSPCSPENQTALACSVNDPASDPIVALYDAGFYNIGVRPSLEDIGIGGNIGPANLPLSHSKRLADCVSAAVPANLAKGFTSDQAVRLANAVSPGDGSYVGCAVPHISARPIEAAAVLGRAWQLSGPPNGPQNLALQDAGSLIGQAKALLTGQPLTGPGVTMASGLLASARDLLAGNVASVLDASFRARIGSLLASATSLLPDPVNPGPNALEPFGPPLQPGERVNVRGAFKVPGLRNVELTAPFMHNGGHATLEQVVQFYDRGGDFAAQNMGDLAPNIAPIFLLDFEEEDLVAFLKTLTDERVRYERAPFDHPSLTLPNGGTPGNYYLFGAVPFLDDHFVLPAVGASGSPVPLGTPGTPFANFPDAVWSRMTIESGDAQTDAPGATLARSLVVRITDAYGNPVTGFPVSFSAPAGGSVSPAQATTGPDGTAASVATLAAGDGDQTFTVSAFTVLDAPAKFVAHALSTTAPAGGSPGSAPGAAASTAANRSAGGCASAPGDAATALLVAAAALVRRWRRRVAQP